MYLMYVCVGRYLYAAQYSMKTGYSCINKGVRSTPAWVMDDGVRDVAAYRTVSVRY